MSDSAGISQAIPCRAIACLLGIFFRLEIFAVLLADLVIVRAVGQVVDVASLVADNLASGCAGRCRRVLPRRYVTGPPTQRMEVQEERRSYPADLDTRHEPRSPEWFVVP